MSANVVNQILFSWLHRQFGAVKPYLPELTERPADNDSVPLTDWRTSVLPSWEGPADFQQETWSTERHPKHRWLPVRGRNAYPLNDTPIAKVDYTYGYSHKHWQVAAQEHYSLLENLEKEELWRYRFPTWDFQLKRMGIQFVAIMGKDINLAKPIPPDDEHHFTVEMPTRLGRRKCYSSHQYRLGKLVEGVCAVEYLSSVLSMKKISLQIAIWDTVPLLLTRSNRCRS